MSEDIVTINDVQPEAKNEKEYVDFSEKSLSEILDIFSGMLPPQKIHLLILLCCSLSVAIACSNFSAFSIIVVLC